jgi:hypothetical protein
LNPDFPLGASSTLFERWRRIFGYFFRSSLQIASYFRLIHVKTTSKSAPTIISNPNGNSGLNSRIAGKGKFFFIVSMATTESKKWQKIESETLSLLVVVLLAG